MALPPDWNPFDLGTPRGRVIEGALGLLVLASVGVVVAETTVDPTGVSFRWLRRVDFTIWVVFCVEYVARLASARPRRRYGLSFFGIVDLMAVLAGFPALRSGLRSAKTLRLLRALRIFTCSSGSATSHGPLQGGVLGHQGRAGDLPRRYRRPGRS